MIHKYNVPLPSNLPVFQHRAPSFQGHLAMPQQAHYYSSIHACSGIEGSNNMLQYVNYIKFRTKIINK